MNSKLEQTLEKIAPIFKDTNAMCAGGAMLALAAEKEGKKFLYDDIDFFFENFDDFHKAVENLLEIGANVSYENQNGIMWKLYNISPRGSIKINTVKIFQPHSQTISRFDLKNSQFYSMYPFNEVINYNNDKTLFEFIRPNIELRVPLILRMLKYNKKGLNFENNIQNSIIKYILQYEKFTEKDYEGTSYDKNTNPNARPDNLVAFLFLAILTNEDFKNKMKRVQERYWFPFEYFDPNMLINVKDEYPGAEWVLVEEKAFLNEVNISDKTREFMKNIFLKSFFKCFIR